MVYAAVKFLGVWWAYTVLQRGVLRIYTTVAFSIVLSMLSRSIKF